MTNQDTASNNEVRTITDEEELLKYGVCRVPLPSELDKTKWAKELSQVTPLIMSGEGDGEYAFYRNIVDEPDFPFDCILKSAIGEVILKRFPIQCLEEIRMDDAFCIHYSFDDHDNTSGAKHTDPSDITLNMCLEKSSDAQGSQVLFYGTKALEDTDTSNKDGQPEQFMVSQEPGFATIHYGDHPHETMPLTRGKRTNLVFTFCYKDPERSGAMMRTCY